MAAARASDVALSGQLGYTSDYVHRGLTQSSGKPAFQAGIGLRLPQGLHLGAWASTVDFEKLGPDRGDGDGYELNLIAGYGRSLGLDWQWDLNVGRYRYFGDQRRLDYNYDEFSGAVTWRDRLRLSLAYAPEVTDRTRRVEPQALEGPRTVLEISGEWPLRRWLSLTAGTGYNNSTEVSDVDYTFWSAGATLRWRSCALGLAHYAADADARQRWPDGRAADRFAATLVVGID